jgi:hypothetical protein
MPYACFFAPLLVVHSREYPSPTSLSTDLCKCRYAGSLFFGTTKGKLEFLNNTVTLFEVEIDLETMDDTIKLWEWK